LKTKYGQARQQGQAKIDSRATFDARTNSIAIPMMSDRACIYVNVTSAFSAFYIGGALLGN